MRLLFCCTEFANWFVAVHNLELTHHAVKGYCPRPDIWIQVYIERCIHKMLNDTKDGSDMKEYIKENKRKVNKMNVADTRECIKDMTRIVTLIVL